MTGAPCIGQPSIEEVVLSWWVPALVGAFLATILAAVWLAALRKLLEKQNDEIQADASMPLQAERSSEVLKPIASFLDPDEDEPNTPLPSQSRAPLSFNQYIEVRGAIQGWRASGIDVNAELSDIFNIDMTKYDEAHEWWMTALDDAEDRLRDVERRVAVFAERYGGTPE